MEVGFGFVGIDVGSSVGGARDGINEGVAVGPSEGLEDGRLAMLGTSVGETTLDLSQEHPQLLNPMSKVLAYVDVLGVLRASLAVTKYSVLIPSMNDKYGVLLLLMLLLMLTCSYFFL